MSMDVSRYWGLNGSHKLLSQARSHTVDIEEFLMAMARKIRKEGMK